MADEPHSFDSTSSSFLRRLRAGDPVAWGHLAGIYGPLVYFWIRRSGLSEHRAEDVAQEVMLAVHGAIARFERRPKQRFRGWLRMITRNKTIDAVRDRNVEIDAGSALERIEESFSEAPDEIDVDSRAVLARRLLEVAQPHFAPRTWQAFVRTVLEDGETAVVAAELKMKPSQVRVARYRVLKLLRSLHDDERTNDANPDGE